MLINKDTLLYGSFSRTAGNFGCLRFNNAFKKAGINAIYKSFSIHGKDSIKNLIISLKTLNFSGAAVSMPFKKEIIKECTKLDNIGIKVKNINTILIKDCKYEDEYEIIGYNTDYLGVKQYLLENHIRNKEKIIIIGNGAFSNTVRQVFSDLYPNSEIYTLNSRDIKLGDRLKLINNATIFNATPLQALKYNINDNNFFIDGNPNSETGKKISFNTAKEQFILYGYKNYLEYFEETNEYIT